MAIFLTIASSAFAADSTDTTTSVSRFDPTVPRFQQMRPAWGMEVQASLAPFSGKSYGAIAGEGVAKPKEFRLRWEWQPTFVQSIGVIGLGVSASWIHFDPPHRFTQTYLSSGTLGLQARYQFRYFRQQLLVPVLGYSGEFVAYKLANMTTGQFFARGPFAGLWFLISGLDTQTAAELYASTRILRSYIVAEVQRLEGGDGNLDVSGDSFFFGLRFEL